MSERNPYGKLNPRKTPYVARLIQEVNRRLRRDEWDDEDIYFSDNELRIKLGLKPLVWPGAKPRKQEKEKVV